MLLRQFIIVLCVAGFSWLAIRSTFVEAKSALIVFLTGLGFVLVGSAIYVFLGPVFAPPQPYSFFDTLIGRGSKGSILPLAGGYGCIAWSVVMYIRVLIQRSKREDNRVRDD